MNNIEISKLLEEHIDSKMKKLEIDDNLCESVELWEKSIRRTIKANEYDNADLIKDNYNKMILVLETLILPESVMKLDSNYYGMVVFKLYKQVREIVSGTILVD